MGKVTVSIEIEASPEKVFAFVTDMEKMNDVTKDLVVSKLTSDGPLGAGSTVHFSATAWYDKGGEWNGVVTEFAKNKNITMALKGANKRSNDQTNYYVFEPTSKGTKITVTMDYKMGKLFDALIAHRMMEKENKETLEKLKKVLEA
jgi:uncharacterized membrane protein